MAQARGERDGGGEVKVLENHGRILVSLVAIARTWATPGCEEKQVPFSDRRLRIALIRERKK